MQLQKAIKKRRSIHSFKKKKVDWRDILDCLEATKLAPMAGGYYSLKFLIVEEAGAKEQIAKLCDQDFIAEAPYVVIFVSDPSVTKNVYPERGDMYMRQQAGAAIQNFMLSLTERELSSCWVGHFNQEKINQLFGIKGNIEAIFPIGYAKDIPKTRQIMASLYNRISFHTWGNKRIDKPKPIEHYAPEGYIKY
ncbi:MAG: nitroreductase family protein [Nanoarchaeota archaeon]|jgi:nitroreductase|nr:nitroreductase family protein [Nanoarchaeota archaeon]